jgi:hypothetical protein
VKWRKGEDYKFENNNFLPKNKKMKKSVFFAIAIIFFMQLTSQNPFNLKLASKHQQQLKVTEIAGDSSLPENFTVNAVSSIATWDMPANNSGNSTLDHFNLYLDGNLIEELAVDERSYFYDCLVYYTDYLAEISAVYDWGETEKVEFSFTSAFLYPPASFSVSSTNGDNAIEITIEIPKNCEGIVPVGLMSFNIYQDNSFLANIPYNPENPNELTFIYSPMMPGIYNFCASAVYDLGPYGFPGETGESVSVCDTVEVVWGFELPFIEDWSSNDFETNNWTPYGENWVINSNEGNQSPSVNFQNTPQSSNYYYSLTSSFINASQIELGDIWLDFDLKLNDEIDNGTEKLIVIIKINNYSSDAIYIRRNEGSFDWETVHLNISSSALKQNFKIKFVASGQNSDNIQSWQIDNIHIYRTCPSACNLALEVDTVGEYEYQLNFSWQSCEPISPPGEWIHWDDGNNSNAIGACDCSMSAAARWEPGQLDYYNGFQLSKIRAYFNDIGYENLRYKIWTGEDANTLIYESDTLQPLVSGWDEFNVDSTIYINSAQEYWVGYSVDILAGYFPLGTDAGPAITGFGDKIRQDGIDWENLSDYGLSYNWNIQFFAKETWNKQYKRDNNTLNFGLNIYRSINGGDFSFFAEVPYIEGQYEYQVPINIGPSSELICYKFTYYYANNNDYCDSEPFTTIDPNIDYVCVLLTGNEKIKAENSNSITIFPNPATSQLNIQSEVEIEEITLLNAVGQVVFSKQINDKQAILNTSGFNSGIYFVKLKTGKGVFNKKIVINH